jgi:hypothetical protein
MIMKHSILLISAIVIAFSVSAQSKKDLKKNKVRSFKESHTTVENGKEQSYDALMQKFDADGNVTEEIDYDKDGKVKSHYTATYDKNGDKTEEQNFSEDGKLKKKKVFKYNAKGDRISEEHYDPSGKLVNKVLISYNANGDKITEIHFDPTSNNPTQKTFYVYDKKGMVIQEKVVDGEGKLIKETRYTYEY